MIGFIQFVNQNIVSRGLIYVLKKLNQLLGLISGMFRLQYVMIVMVLV
jgi:hypothetical protein